MRCTSPGAHPAAAARSPPCDAQGLAGRSQQHRSELAALAESVGGLVVHQASEATGPEHPGLRPVEHRRGLYPTQSCGRRGRQLVERATLWIRLQGQASIGSSGSSPGAVRVVEPVGCEVRRSGASVLRGYGLLDQVQQFGLAGDAE